MIFTLESGAVTTPSITQPDWYKDAIIYELHLGGVSTDANGDGIGDISRH